MFVSSIRLFFDRWRRCLFSSAVLHGLVLWLLLLQLKPVFVKPSLTARGRMGTSAVLYFSEPGNQQTLVAKRSRHFAARLYMPTKPRTKFNARITNQTDVPPVNADEPSSQPEGTLSSSDVYGAISGADIRPAIETTLLDPPISRSEIPAGIQGDVIVEITIDAQGNVTATKLLQGLGYGIDEKILATVRNWRYRPATRDGVPIPSKYDAHWHFPG